MSEQEIRREAMRIGGEKVYADAVVEVEYPRTREVIATVRLARRNMPTVPLRLPPRISPSSRGMNVNRSSFARPH